MPLVHPLVAAFRLVCALMTIKVRRLYRGHDASSFCACRNPFPAPVLVRSETEARSNGQTGKSMVALGIDDDCSRRTHREVDMAVHRGTFLSSSDLPSSFTRRKPTRHNRRPRNHLRCMTRDGSGRGDGRDIGANVLNGSSTGSFAKFSCDGVRPCPGLTIRRPAWAQA